MNHSRYTYHQSKLTELAEELAIYKLAIERDSQKTKELFGKENAITSFIDWAKTQTEKYGPWVDAIKELLIDVGPLLFKNGKYVPPKKWSLTTARIGWYAVKFIIKIII